MQFEGLICPVCSSKLSELDLEGDIMCPHCHTKLKQKKYLAFLEFLMMQGLVEDMDFFDQSLYGDEIKKSETEEELLDETSHDEYEDKSEKMEFVDEKHQLNESAVEEEDFREWDGIEEDWQTFNKKNKIEKK